MSSFLIIIYLIILAAITSFCLIKANIKGWLRVVLIAISFFVASAYYFHIDSLRGYATSEDILESRVSWIEVVNPSETDSGGIYVWAYEKVKERTLIDKLYGINSEYTQPRSFRVPYNKENARKYQTMQQKIKQGYAVKKIKKKKGNKQGNGNEDNRGDSYEFEIIDPRPNLKDQ